MGAICSTGIHPVMVNGYFRAMGYRRTGRLGRQGGGEDNQIGSNHSHIGPVF